MFSIRRIAVATAGPTRLYAPLRAFGSSAAVLKNGDPKWVPALADIPPDGQDDFNNKQNAFRERLAELQKAQESSAFPPISSTSSSSAPAKAADSASAMLQGLGSLSTAKGSMAEASGKAPQRKSGPISNLIYGTKEGRELDAQIEASFSQVLARGKYVHSILTHEVKPDKVEEYVNLIGSWYPRMANIPENRVHLVGSWRTEVGDCDTFGKSCGSWGSRAHLS